MGAPTTPTGAPSDEDEDEDEHSHEEDVRIDQVITPPPHYLLLLF